MAIKHNLVPKHTRLSEEEAKKLLQKYNISLMQLPKISRKDPAVSELDVKQGDIIHIERSSPTNSKTSYYRAVVNE